MINYGTYVHEVTIYIFLKKKLKNKIRLESMQLVNQLP